MAKTVISVGTNANDGTGDPLRTAFQSTNTNFNELYSFLGNGTALAFSGDATVSAGTVTISNDAIDYEKVDDEFTTVDALTAGGTVAVDFDAAQVFTLTPNANTTFNITNPKIGVTKTLILTGSGGGRTADTWTVGGSSGTFNKIAGDYDDASGTKNLYQITCVSATEFWYSISQIAS
jgi:hypothetical protein|tara:strand:- start:261 stop:794 length:534 start_codon:yes stop_codon:yes gene_type:complete